MMRQDDFLRSLLRIAEININGQTPYQGLGNIQHAIEQRLPTLKPVIYENHDLSCGLSWDGKIVCGDRPSINAVKLALHEASNVETFWRPHHLAQRKIIADVTLALRTG